MNGLRIGVGVGLVGVVPADILVVARDVVSVAAVADVVTGDPDLAGSGVVNLLNWDIEVEVVVAVVVTVTETASMTADRDIEVRFGLGFVGRGEGEQRDCDSGDSECGFEIFHDQVLRVLRFLCQAPQRFGLLNFVLIG